MMESNWQKTLELAVKILIGLVAVLVGLYLLGWIFAFFGGILTGLANIIVGLLKFLVPAAIIVGAVYFIFRNKK